VFPGEIPRCPTQPAPDVENIAAFRESGFFDEEFDEIFLSFFFGFLAGFEEAVVDMLAPVMVLET
jgi:hypothetical protein